MDRKIERVDARKVALLSSTAAIARIDAAASDRRPIWKDVPIRPAPIGPRDKKSRAKGHTPHAMKGWLNGA